MARRARAANSRESGRNGAHFPTLHALRIAAALAVLVSHSFALTGEEEPVVVAAGNYHISLGSLGVTCFFVVAGFLVTMSWLRSPHGSGFAVRRFARIWPGYLMVLILAAMVLGPIVTSLSLQGYFSDRDTWSYLVRSSVMTPIEYTLPGVFEDNPFPATVNGSLWSLRYEVLAYACLLGLGVLGLLRQRIVVTALAAGCLLALQLAVWGALPVDADLFGFELARLLELGSFFLIGSAAWLWRDHINFNLAAVVGVLALAPAAVLGQAWLVIASVAVLILWFGTRPWESWGLIRRWGDPSYGTYLYAFPVQQTLVLAGLATSPWALMVWSTLIALPCGYLSWHLVERPSALRLTTIHGRVRRVPASN